MKENRNIYRTTIVFILIFFISNLNRLCYSKPYIISENQTNIIDIFKNASDGDTIIFDNGNFYLFDVHIDKKLTIRGQEYSVIDGKNRTSIFIITSDSVTIENLEITNVKSSYTEDYSAIRLVNCSDCNIVNNKIYNSFFGIYCEHTSNCKISNNYIKGYAKHEFSSGNAMHLWYCDRMIVENNIVTGHRDGIYFEFVKNSIILKNQSFGNLRYGLHFMFSDSNQYLNNKFSKNGAGVAVMFSSHIDMIGNHFFNNIGASSYGLLLKEIYDSKIQNNKINNNTIGIYGESVSRCILTKNDFENNGFAIKIFGSCTNNTFTLNNFISNTFDISSDINSNKNNFINNYWDKYSGYDLDRDGYGDIPYYPVKLFAFISAKSKDAIVLLHSLFISLLDLAESIFPILTPSNLTDNQPLMMPYAA